MSKWPWKFKDLICKIRGLTFVCSYPSSNTSLAIYQNNETWGERLNFLLCSFPSSVKWSQEQNASTAGLPHRHSADKHTWHTVGIQKGREKWKWWLSRTTSILKKKKKNHRLSRAEMTIQQKPFWSPTWASLGYKQENFFPIHFS